MSPSRAAALKLARQIHTRFGGRIAAACEGTDVPPAFVAGLIANEAGKDRKGVIQENATRFEPAVFKKLQQVRDGVRKSWSGITQGNIRGASDQALRSLATSYSLTQVMGWHCINNLNCTVGELRDSKKHLRYAVKLLQMNAADGDFKRGAYMGEFREWNTGSERGKTYHADYVANGMAVMQAYQTLGDAEPELEGHPAKELIEEVEGQKAGAGTEPTEVAKSTPEEREAVETIPAVPPLPVNVPGWVKTILKWGAGINIAGIGGSFGVLRENPEALMAALHILKWGLIALAAIGAIVALGLFLKSMWNAKLANDINMARLHNYANKDTKNVDFSGWKAAPEREEVKL